MPAEAIGGSPLAEAFAPVAPDAKVTILFRPVANAPILQEPKLRAPATRQFSVLAAYLRTRLKLTASDSLYLYINSAFIPAPDAVIGDLFASFATRGELTINYALAQAWG